MRSVDDLMYYGRWKRESLQALSSRRHDDSFDRGGGSVSLNQSYSCASTTATDDERPAGSTRRRRRLRRRGLYTGRGSVASAPGTRPVNLDDSIGSAALDIDSMFRFLGPSTPPPSVDGGLRSATMKPTVGRGLPPSGLSGTGGRPTSVRRTSLRRRRTKKSSSMTDVAAGSTSSSSFNDVQMTSSTVDLKETAATTSSDVQPASRPVRGSGRRRAINETPSSAVDAAAPTQAAQTAVTAGYNKPDELWFVGGEKLNEVCRRILNTGIVDDTVDVTTAVLSPGSGTESVQIELEVGQSSDIVKLSPQCVECPGSPLSETGQGKGEYNVDASSLINNKINMDLHQKTSGTSSAQRNIAEDNYNGVEIELTGPVSRQDKDQFSTHKTTSLDDVAADDVRRRETAASHNIPLLNVEHDAAQFQTATTTCSTEQLTDRLEPNDTMSDLSAGMPLEMGEKYTENQLNDERETSDVVQDRPIAASLDISAMLLPSVELQDILETIYTLTGSDGSVTQPVNHVTDEDRTASPPPRQNPAFNDNNAILLGRDADLQQLPRDVDVAHSTAAHSLDDDELSLLDLDLEMYEYDLCPAAADLADSLRLAIAEDDDYDVDIEHKEYDLDDDDVL